MEQLREAVCACALGFHYGSGKGGTVAEAEARPSV